MSSQNTGSFSISKPGSNSKSWDNKNIASISISVKCRNPFLKDDWSKEITLTDSEIYMYNFIDADRIVATLVENHNFQNTVASAMANNPYLSNQLIAQVKLNDTITQNQAT